MMLGLYSRFSDIWYTHKHAKLSQLSDELFTEMDWDCDGVITEEELITAFFRKVLHYHNYRMCHHHSKRMSSTSIQLNPEILICYYSSILILRNSLPAFFATNWCRDLSAPASAWKMQQLIKTWNKDCKKIRQILIIDFTQKTSLWPVVCKPTEPGGHQTQPPAEVSGVAHNAAGRPRGQ